jgi:miniconductance mechanosensitive channel
LAQNGFAEAPAEYTAWAAIGLAVILLAWLLNAVAKRIVHSVVHFVIKRSQITWDDILLEHHVFTRLSHLAPAIVFYSAAPLFPAVAGMIQRLSMVYMIFVGVSVFFGFVNALVDIYNRREDARQRPIKGYAQLVKIIVFVAVAIIAIGTLMNQSPWVLLSGVGAMTAVIILVFKDTILGFLASIQLTSNDMVRIGDWVEMPKYGADGDVIDVTLHTVKIRNWDKTITTIPTYALISDSFKNWRGMQESGGRRIKRSMNIDMSSIRFCSPEMLDRFQKYGLIREYIKTRRDEIGKWNRENDIDLSELINGRNMTNLGTFRAYCVAYLEAHPQIRKDMTFLVRHLAPQENGIPIEIYVFSGDQVWANYEAIMADIFDHLLAVVPWFELRVFQRPSGYDFRGIAERVGAGSDG